MTDWHAINNLSLYIRMCLDINDDSSPHHQRSTVWLTTQPAQIATDSHWEALLTRVHCDLEHEARPPAHI